MEQTAMVLLMGGKSCRMGTSKAWLLYEDEPFWKRIAAQLSDLGPLYLSVAPGQEMEGLAGFPLIRDEVEGIGPMGGIYSAMRQVTESSVFVCACDMPLMSRDYVRTLLEVWRQQNDSRLCRIPSGGKYPDADGSMVWEGLIVRGENGRVYPTAGIYHRCIYDRVERQITEGNYRMMDLLSKCRIRYVEENSLGSMARTLTNINTQKEYQEFLTKTLRQM